MHCNACVYHLLIYHCTARCIYPYGWQQQPLTTAAAITAHTRDLEPRQVIHGVCEVWCFRYSSRSVSRVWQPPVSALLYMPAAFMLYTPALLLYTADPLRMHHVCSSSRLIAAVRTVTAGCKVPVAHVCIHAFHEVRTESPGLVINYQP